MGRRKTIFEWACHDDEIKKTIPEMIEWLNGIAAESECAPEEIVVRLCEADHWEYSEGQFEITRPMTAEENAAEDRKSAARSAQYEREREEQERREFERLKAKFQPPEISDE